MKSTLWRLFGVVVIGAAGITIWWIWRLPLPPPQNVPIITGAEVHIGAEVHSGTFTIEAPLSLFEAAVQKGETVIASIQGGNGLAFIDYWHPRGDGTFDYHRVDIQKPTFAYWTPSRLNGEATLVPRRDDFTYFSTVLLAIMAFMGGIAFVLPWLSHSK